MCISNPLVSSDGGRSLTKVSPINQSAFSHEDANQLSKPVLPAAVFADDDLDTFSLLEGFLNPCSLGLRRNIKLTLEVRHFAEKNNVSELACGCFQVN